MAILENETGNYFRAEFDESSVRGSRVYVTYSTYVTSEDRQKEKDRVDEISNFINAANVMATAKYTALMEGVQAQDCAPEELAEEDNANLIDGDRFPELRTLQDDMFKIQNLLTYVARNSEVYQGVELAPATLVELSQDTLDELGYKAEWVEDPVNLGIKAEVYCGEYSGEAIDHEFFYNRLKTVMSDNITNC